MYPPDLDGDENRTARRTLRDRIVIDFLDSMKALIVFDGFDEIVAASRRDAVVSRLCTLTRQLERSSIILTSRTGEFNYHIDNMSQFEIKPLSRPQISSFASRWLGKNDGESLLVQLDSSPYNDAGIFDHLPSRTFARFMRGLAAFPISRRPYTKRSSTSSWKSGTSSVQ